MEFKEFITRITEELEDFYGKDAEVSVVQVQKNNGTGYEGIQVQTGEAAAMPVVRLDAFYEAYRKGEMDMDGCVEAVFRAAEDGENRQDMDWAAEKIRSWDWAKDNVYPILLSAEKNEALLETLAWAPVLDLAEAYMIRFKAPGGSEGSVKVTKELMEHYGAGSGELQERAEGNMKKDGYRFQRLDEALEGFCPLNGSGGSTAEEGTKRMEMYILTNSTAGYGAAGILHTELLREFAGGRSFYILPSSIHETIFIPAAGWMDSRDLDRMVKEVNEAWVMEEERLSECCYFYDGRSGRIRMCADAGAEE